MSYHGIPTAYQPEPKYLNAFQSSCCIDSSKMYARSNSAFLKDKVAIITGTIFPKKYFEMVSSYVL